MIGFAAIAIVAVVTIAGIVAAVALSRFGNPLSTSNGSRGYTVTNEAWIVDSSWASQPVIVSGDEPGAEIALSIPIFNDGPVGITMLDPSATSDSAITGNCLWTPTEVVFFEEDQGRVDASSATFAPPFTLPAGQNVFIEVTGVFNHRDDGPCFTDSGSIQRAEVDLPYRVFGVTKSATVDLRRTIAYFDEPEDWIQPEVRHVTPP